MDKSKTNYTSKEFLSTFGKKNGKIVKKDEQMEQEEFLFWVQDKYPQVLYTVDLAGLNLDPKQLKVYKTRSRIGHPDIIFQEWFKDDYCGLAIEFKKTGTYLNMKKVLKNKHLSEQLEYIQLLRERRYIAGFVSGKYNSQKVLDAYLEAGPKSLEVINRLIFPKMKF